MSDELLVDEPKSATPGSSSGKRGEQRGIKWVCCFLRPEHLEPVKDALDALQVVGGMTVTDVRGFGRQKGQVEHYRGGEYTIRFLPKVKVELAVREEDLDPVIAAVRRVACTGQVGDGKIFVVKVHTALRIRTGERGASAL